MLNKYKLITIMVHHTSYGTLHNIVQMNNLITKVKFGGFCHCERSRVNVMDVITQYWMYFVG